MTSKVNGKTGILTPCRSETSENFITKIGHIDYVAGGNKHAKFYGNRPRGVRPGPADDVIRLRPAGRPSGHLGNRLVDMDVWLIFLFGFCTVSLTQL